jgi:general secretion pathway protein H
MVKKGAKVTMPTSATGISTSRSAPQPSRGFSLLELLIVVTIIGIFAGAAVLSLGVVGRDREIERETLRLQSLLSLLREEALMQSRDYGLLFNASGYEFFLYDHQRAAWLPAPADNLLRQHKLPPALRLTLTLENRELVLPPDFETQDKDAPEPQVVLLASGELTPFEIAIDRPPRSGRFILTAQLDGKFKTQQDGFQ